MDDTFDNDDNYPDWSYDMSDDDADIHQCHYLVQASKWTVKLEQYSNIKMSIIKRRTIKKYTKQQLKSNVTYISCYNARRNNAMSKTRV